MKLWKITTIDGKTRPGAANECQWGPGVTHTSSGLGELCGPGFIHAYETSPEVAMLLNPVHGNYSPFLLWECEGEVVKRDGLLKVGTTSLTTVRRVEVACPTPNQLVRAAILLAKQVYSDPSWGRWADSWLSGDNRAREASAEAAAAATAKAAAWAAKAWEAAAKAAAAKAAEAVTTLDIVGIVARAFAEELQQL